VKILLYGLNYAPELTGIGKYTGEMAAWLFSHGHEVRVVAAPPYYPEWKVHDGYCSSRYVTEHRDGVRIWRCPLYVPACPSGLKRIAHLASFALSSLPVMLRQAFWKPDVVFVVEPPLFCAPVAWLTARLSGGMCWLYVQDFEVDAAFELGILPSGRIRQLVLDLERWLLRRFDRVSSISRAMCARLREKGVQNPVYFPNWANLSEIEYDGVGAAAFRQKHGIPNDVHLFLYSGNLGEKQGLELLINAARALEKDKGMFFLLCGEGSAKERLQRMAHGLTNIRFLCLQPVSELAALLSAADTHLVLQRAGAADLVMPSKLTNILAVGGYSIITAGANTELGRLVDRNPDLGIRISPGDAQALQSAIERRARNDPAGIDRSAIRQYAESMLDLNKILHRFIDNLDSQGEEGGE